MAKKLLFVFALLFVVALATASVVEAKVPAVAAGIPADFAEYRAAPGEIWIWETGGVHPALIRCNLGRESGLWYPPAGSVSPASSASCGAKFDLARFAVAIGGEQVVCDAGFNPAKMQINCSRTGK